MRRDAYEVCVRSPFSVAVTAGGACMGVSLCYLRGGSIGAFGWGLLGLLASDFRMGARGGR